MNGYGYAYLSVYCISLVTAMLFIAVNVESIDPLWAI